MNLSIEQSECVIDYVLYEQQIEKEREREREKEEREREREREGKK